MFPDPLIVEVVDGGKYRLCEPFTYVAPNGGEIVVPEGFVTDFASIPRVARVMFPGHDKTRKPAVIHDFLYRTGIGRRKDADLVFRLAMRESGMSAWRRHLAYSAVRIGGWASWGGNEAK